MAREPRKDNPEYVNISPEDFSEATQLLAIEQGEAYRVYKAVTDKLLAAIRNEVPLPVHREIEKTNYTSWGQWQMTIHDKPLPKSHGNGSRPTLAQFLAQQQASGHRV